jgi:hypothetical protein
VVTTVDPALASKIVWLDSLLNNVDRTSRNTNMLCWHKELWLIDHGAALYFHHNWNNWEAQATRPFLHIKDHVLLPQATDLENTGEEFTSILNSDIIHSIVDLIPAEWLLEDATFETAAMHRQAYVTFLIKRIAHSPIFVKEAQHAREVLI